ncbi:MAG TPA: HupE/UreJ family protein [Steroidobacteraceae bacterium]|nr:HupE/UreJ family protein [Steroidobacteraceae bacterium]
MTRTQRRLIRFAVAATGLLPVLALAHPDHGETSSFVAGALHPLGGIDHLLGLITVGLLMSRLGGRYLPLLAAAMLGLLVAAWTVDSDGSLYAAGFMVTSAALIAAAMAATRTATRLLGLATTAIAPRSPT